MQNHDAMQLIVRGVHGWASIGVARRRSGPSPGRLTAATRSLIRMASGTVGLRLYFHAASLDRHALVHSRRVPSSSAEPWLSSSSPPSALWVGNEPRRSCTRGPSTRHAGPYAVVRHPIYTGLFGLLRHGLDPGSRPRRRGGDHVFRARCSAPPGRSAHRQPLACRAETLPAEFPPPPVQARRRKHRSHASLKELMNQEGKSDPRSPPISTGSGRPAFPGQAGSFPARTDRGW
jgi:hypothetical protein